MNQTSGRLKHLKRGQAFCIYRQEAKTYEAIWAACIKSPDLQSEFYIHQDLKKGPAERVAQAWEQHEQDRKRVSQSPKQLRELMIAAHEEETMDFMPEETFFQPLELRLPDDRVSTSFEALQNESMPKNVFASKNVKLPDKDPSCQHPPTCSFVLGAALGVCCSASKQRSFEKTSQRGHKRICTVLTCETIHQKTGRCSLSSGAALLAPVVMDAYGRTGETDRANCTFRRQNLLKVA